MTPKACGVLARRGIPLLAALFALHCFNKPVEPVAPRWDVNLAVPLAKRTYTLGEILEKDPTLLGVVPGSTQIMYRTSLAAAPAYVGDMLSLEPMNVRSRATLGPFGLSPAVVVMNCALPGLVAGAPIPAVPNITVDSIGGTVAGLQQAFLKSGTASLRLRNTYPAPLTLLGPVNLRNVFDGVAASFVFVPATIPPGGEIVASADLSEKNVTARMRLTDIQLSTTGSGGLPVQAGNALVGTLTVGSILAHNAVLSQVPPQILASSDAARLALTDSTVIKEIRFRSGTLNLQFASGVNMNMRFRFTLQQLFRPGGAAYSDSVTLSSHGVTTKGINLAGFTLRSLDGSLLRAIDAAGTVNLYEGSAGSSVIVSETDSIAVSLTSTSLVADTVVAVIKPTRIAVSQSLPLDLGDVVNKFSGTLTIPSASLRFVPRSTISCPMQLDLRFEARDRTGKITAVLPVPSSKVGTGTEPIDFVESDVGAFLSQISGALPDSIRVVGSVILNQNYDISTPSSIGRNSSFGGQLDFGIPLSLGILGGALTDTATISDTTGDGVKDARIDQAVLDQSNWARLHIDIDNGLPIDVKLKMGFMDLMKRQLFDLPQGAGDSITVQAGLMSGGDVVAPATARVVLELGPAEIRRFNEAQLVACGLAFGTPGGGVANFRTTDRIGLRVWLELSEQVKP